MNRLFALRKNQSGSLCRTHNPQSLRTIVVLQPWRICTEHCSPSKRERAIQRSSYSSPRSDEHEAQLQRNSVNSRQCAAI